MDRLEGLHERSSAMGITPLFKRKEILAITGVRRGGKSSLMRLLIRRILEDVDPRNVLYIDCDDPTFADGSIKDLIDAYHEAQTPEGMRYVFLDEVQTMPMWERWLKRYYDAGEPIKFVVSGWNSSLLSSEYATSLTGRDFTYVLFPLTFAELLEFKGVSASDWLQISSSRAKIKNLMEEYMRYGGFPEVVIATDTIAKVSLLKEYYNAILAKDIILRYDVRERDGLVKLARFMVSNIAKPASATSLGRAVKLDPKTVQTYLDHLREAFLFMYVNHFSYSLKAQLDYPMKIYCVDTGLRNAVSFRFSEDAGRLMENLVFLKLMRRGEVYYWREGETEVDFVLRQGADVTHLVQSCYDLDDPKTRKREESALLKAMQHFRLKRGTIVTWDEEGERKEGGKVIEYHPLWRWLLEWDHAAGDGLHPLPMG